MLVPLILFNFFSLATVVWFRAAICESVSPLRIVTVFPRLRFLLLLRLRLLVDREVVLATSSFTTTSDR